jgi:hypothetical protein
MKKQFIWFVERAKELGVTAAEKYSAPCELCHDLYLIPGAVAAKTNFFHSFGNYGLWFGDMPGSGGTPSV